MELTNMVHRRAAVPTNERWLPRSLRLAIIFNVLVTLPLLPVAGQSFDLAGLTGNAGAWLRWGRPLFYYWKFGADLMGLAIGAQGFAFILHHLGMGGAAALTTTWKIPLVAANLLTALVLYDIAKRLRSNRPLLVPILWLLSPVPIFVAVGFGQVEPLTILAFVLAADLILRKRFVGSGIVIGLGIGIEYLPALALVVVAIAALVGLMRWRDAIQVGIASIAAMCVCFLPPLLTQTGRSSLLGGLQSSYVVTTAVNHSGVGTRSPSLWLLLGDIAPGSYWFIVGVLLCLGITTMLAIRARRRGSDIEHQRYFVVGFAVMLLVVTLLDPGSLPQFSDLVFGGLCLLSLVVAIPGASIIFGPFLQLLVGVVWVYGGSFQSFWYDMWSTTGDTGWRLPQSATLATWLGAAGTVVVVIGLAVAIDRASHGVRISTHVPRGELLVACLVGLFFAVWSCQPAYWVGVGPGGPSLLPVFRQDTASITLPVRHAYDGDIIELEPQLRLLRRSVEDNSSLSLTLGMRSLEVPAGVGFPGPISTKARISLGSLPAGAQVGSLWIEVIVGQRLWDSTNGVRTGSLPVLVSNDHEERASSSVRIAPGWVVCSYSLPVQVNASSRPVVFTLEGKKNTVWQGTRDGHWVAVGVRSMRLPVLVNGVSRDLFVSASPPPVDQPAEQLGVATGLPVRQRLTKLSTRFPTQALHYATVDGARLELPLSYPLGKRVGTVAVLVVGVLYAVLIGLGSVVGGKRILSGDAAVGRLQGNCSEKCPAEG